MKKINFLLSLIALMLFSCDNYLDVNDDPNRLLLTQTGPDKLLPAAQVNSFRVQAIGMNQLGNVFMNSWASNVASFTGGYAREFQLNIDNSFYNNIFDGLYLNVANFQEIIKRPNINNANDNYLAAAKICKVHYMQYIVDLYGDVPYTQAFLGASNTTPKYNDDQFIYRELFKELDQARALIAAQNPEAIDISSYDVMLQGDMSRWEEFANTIELRMLLRMSNSTGAVATYRDNRLQALSSSGASFVTQDVTLNPGYSSATDTQMNPFNSNFTFTVAGAATQNWTFVAMSGHAFKYLRSNPSSNNTEVVVGSGVFYPGVADPRAGRIFRGTLKGVTQGSTAVDVPTAGGTPARNGYGTFNPYLASPEPVAVVADILKMGENDGYVMTAMESHFLQAEAAVRYPSLFSGALSNFDQGISKSFNYRGVTTLTPTAQATYKTAISTKAGLGWPASTTDDLKIRAIMTQKWIALMSVHGIESFIDYQRTGYPVTPLALNATQTRKPRRLIYPVSESVANSANVPNITLTQAFATTDPSHPFWMLGDPALGN